MTSENSVMPLNLISLPPEIIRCILKELLPYQEEIVLHPREYFYSTESLVPAGSPVPTAFPAVLATNRLLNDIGSSILYGSNEYTFHFKASRQYKWPKRNPRHGFIFPHRAQTPPPRGARIRDGSYSGFDRLPRSQAWNLLRVNVQVHDNLQRGFLELRACFDAFTNAVVAARNLRFFRLDVEATQEQDYDTFMAVYEGDGEPRALKWQEEQKIRYMLEPLIDIEGLTSAVITGAGDGKFVAKLTDLMTSSGQKVARTLLRLKSPKLHWMKHQKDTWEARVSEHP